jgi:hypothetical protein
MPYWIAQAVAVAYLAAAFADFATELQPALQGYDKLVSVAGVVALFRESDSLSEATIYPGRSRRGFR